MQAIDGVVVYSASDLVGFLACEHLTQQERAAAAGRITRPAQDDPELDVLRRRGEEHERRYLDDLRAAGRAVTSIVTDGSAADRLAELERAADETLAAMARGDDVIYQATFFDGRWRGHADFLERVDAPEQPSRWGPYHYEVVDTKLARHVKAGAVLQICSYIDQLTRLQGVEPDRLHVVLGGAARERATLRVSDFMAYYRAARERFEAAAAEDRATYPEPVEHCRVCRWSAACEARRAADDHLSLVAGIGGHQRRALVERGVTTLAALGRLPLPVEPPLTGMGSGPLRRIREQARIQLDARESGDRRYELLLPEPGEPLEPDRGLAMLPAPSPGDLFFDIEGDPYALGDGIDYLFGVMTMDGSWHAFWSRDHDDEFTLAGEKRAFEELIDLLAGQMAAHPDAHVYHYAPYEPTALKRLMGRHGTRETEVDELLRGGRFVDLYRTVRQGVRASVDSYSIKRLEPFYGFERSVGLRDATSSIVEFEAWLQLGAVDRHAAGLLERIEAYNRDDVISTRALRDWLERLRRELAAETGQPVPRPSPRDAEAPEELSERLAEVSRVAALLTAGQPPGPQTDPEPHARWLLSELLSWHRREGKSFWWRYYHLRDELSDAERIDTTDALGGLVYEGVVDRADRSLVHRYSFPPQDHDIRQGGAVRDPATDGSPGTVVRIDDAHGFVDLKRAATSAVPHPTSLLPYNFFSAREHEASLLRFGAWVAEHDISSDDEAYRAGRDLLLRRAPRLRDGLSLSHRVPGEDDLAAARRIGLALDGSTLAIQGPPGSGKTYTAARMILDLVRDGRRVGVTATSHKVIGNLLRATAAAAREAGTPIRIGQRATDENLVDDPGVVGMGGNAEARDALAFGRIDVVGGTSWLWAREEMAGRVDALFVDEAGQMSLANVLSVAPAGRSLVLLGDPQQLEQPQQGTHPPGVGASALAHLLGGSATMPPDLGLFLETTWRLHPALCRFTSEVFYDDRLAPEPHLAAQEVLGPPPLQGTGVRLVGMQHAGNDSVALEEVEEVARLAELLTSGGGRWVDQDGQLQLITWQELLIVAPYNAQVGALQRRLPLARIGTVDKFQGQEAPVVIYSTTSSSAEDAPRGMDFLYSGHRLNVATSRARCLAVLVSSDQLFRVRAHTPEQMRMANAFCRYLELATSPGDGIS